MATSFSPVLNPYPAVSPQSGDLTELIGKCILPDLAIFVVARKYGYWCDTDTPTCGSEYPSRKKRKRLHKDDVGE